MSEKLKEGRRAALATLGGLGAAILLDVDCGGGGQATPTDGGEADAGTSPPCTLTPTVERGPYFVDDRLNRSDIRSDTNNKASPNPRPGLPFAIELAISSWASGVCTPLKGAQVDIWQCDATGSYSDEKVAGYPDTTGQDFLRGYQLTDASGVVRFTSIYPGWYAGRTAHVHVKVRLFDASRKATTEFTTQVFFDDGITDGVYAIAPYAARPARDTRNATDGDYAKVRSVLDLTGAPASGYAGKASIVVKLGLLLTGG